MCYGLTGVDGYSISRSFYGSFVLNHNLIQNIVMKKDRIEKSFEELKDTRFRDSTNLMRVQIDLFLNMLNEVEKSMNNDNVKSHFKSSYFGSEKTLTEAGRDLIFSILENIDYEWERLILKILTKIEKDNVIKYQQLESEFLEKFEGLSKELYTTQYNAGIQMDQLLAELMNKVKEAKQRRKQLLDSLRELVEQDMKQINLQAKKNTSRSPKR